VGRRTGGDLDGTLIAAEGTGAYGATAARRFAAAGYQVTEAPTPSRKRLRGQGKTDQLDALAAARTSLAIEPSRLRHRRADGVRDALQTLTSLRDLLNTERLATINALTALVRSHDLGIDARRRLTASQIRQIAAWRSRAEGLSAAVARRTAIRHARAIGDLSAELAANKAQIHDLVTEHAPALIELPGVGPVSAAVILTVWSHPGRIKTEAAFAAIAGTSPIPVSSGNTDRQRLNRGGDRRLNRAIGVVVLTRWRTDPTTHAYIERRRSEGKSDREIRRCLRRYVTRQTWRTLNADA
jgi:transposase